MIALRYALFAGFSTLVNLATQALVVRWAPLGAAILAGTAAGFAVKYLLDKHWIFFDRYESTDRELWKVALYGAFSVVTTLIFWSTEISFWILWRTPAAKYTGAGLGLAVGYAAKYALDRAFVFRQSRA